ncbi:MAG: L,D-transpeptidase family protein, partial [Rhodospirillales bacterium]
MDMIIRSPDIFYWQNKTCRCALGRGGIISTKTEGDGGTPVGRFPLRQVLFRPDRLTPPKTRLPIQALADQSGWCDDPNS